MTITDLNDPEIREELGEIVQEMLDGIVEVSIPDGALPPAGGHQGKTIESTLTIDGGAEPADLTVRIDGASAVALTAAMISEAPDEVTLEEACETMGELTNVLGGSIKSLIDEETSLGTPTSEVHETSSMAPLISSVEVRHQLGCFEVRIG
ncbi:MAG: chemotaxis protein CheX [Actinomycetia bacterium]|nr:chemotaxis protein CheX [Actinomycetes bacterium]